MSEDFNLTEEAGKIEQEACDLNKLKEMVDSYQILEAEINELKEELDKKKKVFQQVSQEQIPQYLQQFGLSDIKLDNGKKVSIKEELAPTIKDYDKFINFLEERNEGDIVKFNLAFKRMDKDKQGELREFLFKNQYDYSADNKVHHQTLTKYFRTVLGTGADPDQLKEGIEEGVYIHPDSIQGFAEVFTYWKTKIK